MENEKEKGMMWNEKKLMWNEEWCETKKKDDVKWKKG